MADYLKSWKYVSTASPCTIQTPFREQASEKTFACRRTDRHDEAWTQAFYRRDQTTAKMLCVVFLHINSAYVCLLVTVIFIDFCHPDAVEIHQAGCLAKKNVLCCDPNIFSEFGLNAPLEIQNICANEAGLLFLIPRTSHRSISNTATFASLCVSFRPLLWLIHWFYRQHKAHMSSTFTNKYSQPSPLSSFLFRGSVCVCVCVCVCIQVSLFVLDTHCFLKWHFIFVRREPKTCNTKA